MLYDFRELILRDILLVSEGDPNYYFKRFKKAMRLLSETQSNELIDRVDYFRSKHGLGGYSIRDIEQRMYGKAGLKVRTENDIKIVTIRQLALDLAEIDDWLDEKIKEIAKTIRFSQPQDAFKAT